LLATDSGDKINKNDEDFAKGGGHQAIQASGVPFFHQFNHLAGLLTGD
jgi:hypothetical protein